MQNQLPPHSEESERATIGSLLIDPDAIHMISHFLKPEDFYIGRHGIIYGLILDMAAEGVRCDVLTLGSRLSPISRVDELNEVTNITAFIDSVPTAIGIVEYAKQVEACSIRRKLIQAAGKIATLGFDEKGNLNEQLDEAETAVFGVRGERGQDGISKPRQYTGDYLDWFSQASQEPQAAGLPTGIYDLDRVLGGFESPHQYILAARPGMGKSAFAGQIALNLALKHGKRVAFYSLEMSKRQIMNRFIAHLSGIDSRQLKKPWLLSDEQRTTVYEYTGQISDSRLFIDDTANLSPADIRAKTMRLYGEHGVDLVIVDHLHIMRADRKMNRTDQEYSEMTKTLAQLGKTIHAPILTLAQLNRSVEARQNKRPQMSDLRESGGIEENAYGILFLYRDDYYNEFSERPGITEIIIGKNREGDTSSIDTIWKKETTTFRNMTSEQITL